MLKLARFESGVPFITYAHPPRKLVELLTAFAHELCRLLPRYKALRVELRPPGTWACTAQWHDFCTAQLRGALTPFCRGMS
jgi:hypothetical protein